LWCQATKNCVVRPNRHHQKLPAGSPWCPSRLPTRMGQTSAANGRVLPARFAPRPSRAPTSPTQLETAANESALPARTPRLAWFTWARLTQADPTDQPIPHHGLRQTRIGSALTQASFTSMTIVNSLTGCRQFQSPRTLCPTGDEPSSPCGIPLRPGPLRAGTGQRRQPYPQQRS
jgi:hypothetical protein